MDRIHLLIGLKPKQSPAEIANLLKGESSNWINKSNFIPGKFAWQNGYAVFSVSESQVKKVRQYIIRQEEHHNKNTFQEEVNIILNHYGIKD